MREKLMMPVGVLLLLLVLASQSLFIVDQRQYAIVFQLGEVKKVITEPGLKLKLPFVQNVRFLDKRILTMDRPESERFLTSEKQNVIVDYFVKWRIIDPQRYYEAFAGDEAQAISRLDRVVNDGLRAEFGKHTVHDVISSKRDAIMREMVDRLAKNVVGVEIIDVRLKRVEYPPEVSMNVYSRMEAERKRVANEHRFRGEAEGERIKADADRQRDIIVAQAGSEALQIQGEGDAKAAAIYAEAYNADPEFYSFYRSLQAYKASFAGKDDIIVVAPDTDFFKYLKTPQGKR